MIEILSAPVSQSSLMDEQKPSGRGLFSNIEAD
jgi:hypothetical protein